MAHPACYLAGLRKHRETRIGLAEEELEFLRDWIADFGDMPASYIDEAIGHIKRVLQLARELNDENLRILAAAGGDRPKMLEVRGLSGSGPGHMTSVRDLAERISRFQRGGDEENA